MHSMTKVSNSALIMFHLTPLTPSQFERSIWQTHKELKKNHLSHIAAPLELWPFPCNVVVQMIRITQVEEERRTILRMDGWLQGEEVAELLRVSEAAGSEVALDLSELRMADREGIEALLFLANRGVELRHMSPLIALLLAGNQTNRRNLETTKVGGSRGNGRTLPN